MKVFIGIIDHALESKFASTFAREESPEKKKFVLITKFLIRSSYIHHEVLDCFPFFSCLSFLELVNSGSHTIRQTLDRRNLRDKLVSSVVRLCQCVSNIRFTVTPSQQGSSSSNRFSQGKTLTFHRRSLVLHGKSCAFTSMNCVKNTIRVNDETTSDLGDFLIDDGVVITSLHNFQPQESYEFGLFLCCRLSLSRTG